MLGLAVLAVLMGLIFIAILYCCCIVGGQADIEMEKLLEEKKAEMAFKSDRPEK